jgi:heme/copper-type cytochrome/quinol oxidase subunit 2
MRIRPRRETRGVSRSKCGDLITATVPVTWAASIIVNESTDAIDYYDGFGTTELVIGVRAYQWGWEYYYPKDIDLNYNIKPSYSSFVGNSLKYTKTSELNLQANNLWKYYQNKTNDQVITPAHLLVIPNDNYKLLNFINFNDIGSSNIQEINAFKKIRMFSKTYTSNLSFVPNNYSQKFKTLSNLYINDSSFTDSYLYGLKRQHNYLSSNALLNNQSTFVNMNSINKFINFNFQNNLSNSSFSNYYDNNFFKKLDNSSSSSQSLRLSNLINNINAPSPIHSLNKTILYPNYLSLINDDSDKKKTNYPIYKLFNNKLNKNNFYNFNNLNKLNLLDETSIIDSNNELKNSLFNEQLTYKNLSLFSSNQSVALPDRHIRNFVQNNSSLPHLNYSLNSNSISNYTSIINSNVTSNNYNFLNLSKNFWSDNVSTVKYLTSRISVDYPYSPISSNHPSSSLLDYDNLSNTLIENIPNVLQGKEESTPATLTGIYWNFYWANSNVEWKLYNSMKYHNMHNLFYMPMFSFYYDYDFRNWQALELLEDAFWESIYSIYTHDEYLTLAKDFSDFEYFDKFSNFYNKFNRNFNYKDKILTKPFFKDTNSAGNFYVSSLYLDDFISPINLINTKNFSTFPLFSILNEMDESYESLKYLSYVYNFNNKNSLNLNSNYFQPYSYLFVFDSFRSDYSGFSWYTDETNFSNLFAKLPNFSEYLNNLNCFDFSILSLNNDLNNSKLLRFNNSINLRNTVKNSIVTYNAIQKVFKTRFDESRSNAKLADFANLHGKQTFISAPRIQYEKLLGKNKESFFKINFYKNSFQKYFNNFYDSSSSLNFYFYDFPFLLAMKSDSSRYLWFDWFAKWGMYEVQPSSSSRYAIYGMPYFSKNFEFNSNASDNINESETYLLRLSRARRNYLPNWVYTPYFYSRNVSWYKNNIVYDIFQQNDNSLTLSFNLLENMSWYWKDLFFIDYHSFLFTPSHSGNSTYSKLNWKPQNSIQSYYYNVSALIDILTKREYLYREFLSNNNKIVNLPFYLTSNPTNPLINEIKSSFLFIDPIIHNNEYSRDLYYNSLNFFNFTVVKSFLTTYGDFLNLSLITDYLFYYFFNNNSVNTLKNNSELYKNQYKPMRKGITNMIRLHATGAIAMPIEIRLQVLASSKDVIHSWSIPSAGIKIDCVPGYSSHRVMIFLVSGIFWGQCMEICGRYHHWMPIVVYFMKRDLFFLWCTHFVFLTGSNNIWNINDRAYTDYVKTVSFDKYSWLSELSN